jgi:hypothetical protein
MLKLSLTSRLLDRVGCAFIGTPKSLGVPDDFYHVPGDRFLPDAEELALPWTKIERIGTDAFRRRLMMATAWAASAYATVVCLALFLLARLTGLHH